MNELQIFENVEFGQIRTVEENGKVLFCGFDVAKALGYAKPRDAISHHCRCAVKQGIPHPQNPNKTIEMTFISEGDLYRLISHSHLPKAELFESWIFDEVLPTIRKTGGYVANEDLFINTYLPYADENTKNLFRLQLNTINQLNHKIETDKPLVAFAEQISDTTSLIDIGAYAKLLKKKGVKIGRNILFEWLRNNGYLRPNNEPYQQYINQGYFKTREYTYIVEGEPKIGIKTYVTGKGQHYLYNKLSALGM